MRHTDSVNRSSKVCLFIVSIGVIVAIALGCGGLVPNLGSLLPGTSGSGTTLEGTWKTTQITQNGTSVGCPGTIGTGATAVSCEQEIRTYSSNNNWNTTAPADLVATGTWQLNTAAGISTLSVTNATHGNTITSGILTFSGDNNTFYWVVNGVTYQNQRQ